MSLWDLPLERDDLQDERVQLAAILDEGILLWGDSRWCSCPIQVGHFRHCIVCGSLNACRDSDLVLMRRFCELRWGLRLRDAVDSVRDELFDE